MSEEHEPPKAPVKQKTFSVTEMEHRRGGSFSHIYCNTASFSITFFDFSITFGEITSDNPDEMHIEDRARVTMSLEHAQALLVALQHQLTSYEKKYGATRKVPPVEEI